MDRVFKALADRERRRMLDLLLEHGGRTLGEICGHFRRMSRFGVMKHLRVLGRARLVVVRREGRCAFHYLNPVPIREIADRWMAEFAPALTALKGSLEQEGPAWRRKPGTCTKSTSARRSRGSGTRSPASRS